MLGYVIRRVLWAGVLFVVLTMFTFVIFFVVPGTHEQLVRQQQRQGTQVRLRDQVDLSGSVARQYVRFLDRAIVHGSLGSSFYNRRDVGRDLRDGSSIMLSVFAGGLLLWLLISIPIGIWSALRPRSLVDRVGMVFVLVGVSAHPAWIGLVFLYLFSSRWNVLPGGGYCDLIHASTVCGGPRQWALHLILPWIATAMLFAALYTRMIRAAVTETLQDDYVLVARAKGGSEWRVLRGHVLRNAMLPVLTMLGMDLGVAFGGSVFVESVFGLPGVGLMLRNAAIRLDLPVLVGVTLFLTSAILILNLLVDVLYAVLDPRARVGPSVRRPRLRLRRRTVRYAPSQLAQTRS
ncbi:MAG: ABC transporter permease [Gaiellaceae bacterium]